MTGVHIALSDVRVRRCGRTILEIARIDVPAGSFVGIIGANGAGKTTLLNICAGLVRPDCGAVAFDGSDLTKLGSWQRCRLRKRIGYIPQSAQYNAELPFTVREVVAMGRTSVRPLLAPLGREDYAIVDQWIDVLGLSSRRSQTFRSLSGGEQQKVLIARAMSQQPQVLMLDEACANLDFHWKYQISEIVERLYRQTRVTVLMVSHDTSVLPGACERLILLHAGRVLCDGQAEQVLSNGLLDRAYEGGLQALAIDGRRYIVRGLKNEDRAL